MPEHTREPVGPVDGRLVPRFAGSGSFARLPEIDRVSGYDVAILGVPFDNGTSYRPGARFGPMAVRQASRHLRPGHHVELDCSPFRTIQAVDAGDVPVTPFAIDVAMDQIAGYAGGLSSRELLSVLRGLTGLNLVSGDVVEVSPPYDHAEVTAIAAATVVYDLLTLLARRAEG